MPQYAVLIDQKETPGGLLLPGHKDGLLTDGPFVESREVIAGLLVAEAAGAGEVRPPAPARARRP